MNEDYERLAEYYDLIWPRTEDLDWYRELAVTYGSPVLELACGTGRLSCALAEHGARVIGIDRSLNMLRYAEARRRLMSGESRVEFRRADMTTFQFDQRFSLIVGAFSCIFELPEREERVALYRRCRDHLADVGALAIDASFHPRGRGPEWGSVRPNGALIYKGTFPHARARRIQYFMSDKMDDQLCHTKAIFLDHLSNQDEIRRVHFEITLRYVPPDETEAELISAGFTSIEKFGGFRREPMFDEVLTGRGRQIFIASA